MRGIGCTMMVLAIGSLIIPLFGLQFRILSWIDNWGLAAGIGIRLGFVVLGGLLVFLGAGDDDSD
ncbi:MAG: hypothetical protein RIC55_11455 [Pirellulaceae bacterium]